MQKFVFQIEMKVADCWVADGFGGHTKEERVKLEESVAEAIQTSMLTYAYGHEFFVKVKTISHPPAKVIAKLQGYTKELK